MQTRSVNKYIFFFLISVFNAATVSADNLDAGKKAYLDYDFDSAVKIFEPLAQSGDEEAQRYLELIYKSGYQKPTYKDGKAAYLRNDYKRAFEILLPLAKNGDSWSQYIVSLMYESGNGVEKDQEEAIKWLILAAESGVPKIQYDLGIRYFYGYGIEKNYSEAAKWWRSSANAGIADSQYNLGLMKYRGIGIPKDKEEAKLLVEKAATQGHDKAQHRLAMIYALDEKDFETGLIWLKKSAKQNNVEAQYNLGIFFEKGYGLQKDLNKAKEWYRLAADQGLESAVEKLKTLEEKQNVEVRLENNIDFAESEQQSSETTQVKSSNKLNLTNWLREQAPNQYIIQLVSVVTEKAVINFIEKETFHNDRVGYVEVTVNGITRYAAIYGLYDSYENAKTAISALPPSMNTKPWVRKIEIIKKILN
jgi:TPR repeat protein